MKKRTIIAIIITTILVVLTNKFWLIKKPVNISMFIEGKGNIKIETRLNKKDSNYFEKYKSNTSAINLDETVRYEVKIKKITSAKRLQFIIQNVVPQDIYEISNLIIDNGKININDFENFVSEEADLKIKDQKLFITPKNSTIQLLYTPQVNLKSNIEFDYRIFLIIAIISFGISYQITSYLAEFKTQAKQSRIDIVFIVVCVIILFIPMSKLSQKTTSPEENRKLATMPKLFLTNSKLNNDFGKEFDSYFSDRFFPRSFLIKIYNNLNYKLHQNYVKTGTTFIYKNNGWMFRDDNLIRPDKKTVNMYINNLNQLNQDCKKNNIKLYIVIVPNKWYMEQTHNLRQKKHIEDNAKDLVETAANDFGLNIITAEKELKELQKKDYIFYKTDPHLTDAGIYELYRVIINRINKDFPDIKPTPLDDFNMSYNKLVRASGRRIYEKGFSHRSLGVYDPQITNVEYKYYDYKYPNKISISGHSNTKHTHINNSQKYKMLIIGNSFQESLTYFLNTNFHIIEKYRSNDSLNIPKRKTDLDMIGYKKTITNSNADIMILIMDSHYIKPIRNMYNDEEAEK